MRKDIMPIEVKKPFEVVQELKGDEYKVPSFEKFMKTYESDDKVIDSYEDEFNSQVVQGPQYGPGKRYFYELYRKIRNKLGWPTIKISCDSDAYRNEEDYNYACAMIYAMNGEFKWENLRGDACGRNGKSFYVIIKITNFWPSGSQRPRGAGMVHHYLIEKALGYEIDNSNFVCGAGFAWNNKEFRATSYYMNQYNQNWSFCENDTSSDQLSEYEEKIARFIWEKYKECNGDFSKTYYIPDDIDRALR